MVSLAEFTDSFYQFERDHQLFEQKIGGIYFWALIRDRIHDNILIQKGLLKNKSQTVPSGLGGKIKSFSKYLVHATANSLSRCPQADTLIINHPRKVKKEGRYIDIYSQWLVDDLKKKQQSYLVLDMPLNWSGHPMLADQHTRNAESFSIIKKVFYKYFKKSSNLENNDYLKQLSEKLIQKFGNDGDLIKTCFQQMQIFLADRQYYLKLLRKISPKKIYYVVINSMFGMIAAAHQLGIQVEEIQHGLMCRYHLNYSFPYNDHIPYFPDRFCLFGKYWGEITPLPLPEFSLDYYVSSIREYEPGAARESKNNKIMFLTQLNFSPEMFRFLKKVLEQPGQQDFEFIIKLHPSEYHVWREIYPELEELIACPNVTLIDNFDTPLYELFKQADSVAGVASTSLFEALYFGCDVYLLNIPGVDWVRPLMDERFSTFVEKPEDFLPKLRAHKLRQVDMEYIFYSGIPDDSKRS